MIPAIPFTDRPSTRRDVSRSGVAPWRRATFLPVKPLARRAFYLFIFSIPFETLDPGFNSGRSFSLSKLTGYLFMLCSLVQPKLFFRRPPRAFYYFLTTLAILGVSATLRDSYYTFEGLSEVVTLAQMLILFWISYNLMLFPEIRQNGLLALIGSCVLFAFLQFAGVTASGQNYAGYERVGALGESVNTVGVLLAVGLVGLVGLAYDRRQGSRLRGLACGLSLLLAWQLIQTGSRGALVGLAAGTIAILLQYGGASTKLKGILVAGVVLGLVVFMSMRSGIARFRWEQTLQTENKMAGREDIYSSSVDMTLEKPLLGWGPGRNGIELGRRVGWPGSRDTHNLYLWFLTELGAVGAVPFFVALAFCVRQAWRARKTVDGVLPLALLVTVLTINLNSTYYNRKWFWLILALSLTSGTTLTVKKSRGRQNPLVAQRFPADSAMRASLPA